VPQTNTLGEFGKPSQTEEWGQQNGLLILLSPFFCRLLFWQMDSANVMT
jgi:hypothetical protein